jgi:thiamine kinase-like enzyme
LEREDKPAWSAVPRGLRAQVEGVLGSRVARAVRAYGGYGPSATFMLTTAVGRRAFLKATYPLPQGSAVRWALAREERVYRRLGDLVSPWAPAYLGSVRAEAWHGLLLEPIDGERLTPWSRAKARRAARSYAAFHASTVGRELPRWLSRGHLEFSSFWRSLREQAKTLRALAALSGGRRDEAASWLSAHVDRLAEAERGLARVKRPHALLHLDTRSDNVRLQRDLLRIFDWPFAATGPSELDLAAFAQSIASEGGPRSEEVVKWYAEALPVRDDVLVASVVGLAGYFADCAPKPAIPELPRLRAVQRQQLRSTLAWAARLLDLPDPDWLEGVPA